MRLVVLLIGSVIGAGGGNVLLRAGMARVGGFARGSGSLAGQVASIFTEPHVLLGLALYAVSMVLWLELLSGHQLTYIYPVFVAALFVFVTVLSVLLLGEAISWLRIAGLAVIAMGITLSSLGG